MTGIEIAQLVAPFAKWGAIVFGALLLVWLTRWWIRQSAKDQERLKIHQEMEAERSEAEQDYRNELARLHERWLARRRLRDRQGGGPL